MKNTRRDPKLIFVGIAAAIVAVAFLSVALFGGSSSTTEIHDRPDAGAGDRRWRSKVDRG